MKKLKKTPDGKYIIHFRDGSTRVMESLSFSDLSWADLSFLDLRFLDLSGASLDGADLSGATLRGADLRGATLRGADLRGASLDGASLDGARIGFNCNMTGINCACYIAGFGSQNRGTTAIKIDDEIVIGCGCFQGTLSEFESKIEETHEKNPKFLAEYRMVVQLIRLKFEIDK